MVCKAPPPLMTRIMRDKEIQAMIVDWYEADSVASTEAILVSGSWSWYMQCTDAVLRDYLDAYQSEHSDELLAERVLAELARREKL
jgi:hypothetical protein